jgi:hypothetical protein
MKKSILLLLVTYLSLCLSAQNNPLLLGVASYNGLNHSGSIIQYHQGDNTLVGQYNFPSSTSQNGPNASLSQGGNGKLYGLNITGGPFFNGSIYEYDYYNDTTITLSLFDTAVGIRPSGSLLMANNGLFYGLITNASGVTHIFSYQIGGTNVTQLASLPTNPNGGGTQLIQCHDGNLYGIASASYLISGSTYDTGSIFKYNIGSSTYSELYHFNHGSPSVIVEAGADTIYGMSTGDGIYGGGTIFRYVISTASYTDIYDFSGNLIAGNVFIHARDGNLYGVSSGFSHLIKYDLRNNTLADLHTFSSMPDGLSPCGIYQSNDSLIYGLTYSGGVNNLGTIFEYNINTSSYNKKVDLSTATGSYPGMSLISYTAGPPISTSPVDVRICLPDTAYFIASANGRNISTQWQVSADGGTTFSSIAGATDTIYSFVPSTSQNRYKYRAIFIGGAGADTSTAATLITDSITAYFTLQPSNTAHLWYATDLCVGSDLTYIWNWGDSTQYGSGDTPSHTYDTAGYYQICVHISDTIGCTANYCDSSLYLYKDQSSQMVQLSVILQSPNGINTITTDPQHISYYAAAIHFTETILKPSDIALYDLSGRVVIHQNSFTGNAWNINTDIASGVYIVHIQNDNYSGSKKIVITH